MALLLQPSGAGVREMIEAMEHERGAFVVGIFVQTCLLGMVAAQTTAYFRRGSKDPIYFKVLLIFVVSVLSVKSLMNLKTLYATCLFARYGKRIPAPFPWTDRAAVILNDVPLIAAQAFLCYRLWVASLKRVLPTLLALLGTLASLISFILFATNVGKLSRHIQAPIEGQRLTPLRCSCVVEHTLGKNGIGGRKGVWLLAWAFCLCITDVYLSATIAYYSLQTRKKAVGHRLDYMLSRLASLAITTCMPPAIVSALMAILEIISPSGRSWNFCTVILGALYTVCILHALNARHQILAEARSRSTMKNPSPSVTGHKDPTSSSSNAAKKLAFRSKINEEDQTLSGTKYAKDIYSIDLQ